MKKHVAAGAFAVVLMAVAGSAWGGQQPPQPQPVTVQALQGGLYMLKGGSGANGGFCVCDKGVVVIDAKMTADATRQSVAEIAKITSLPITHILITHSDLDHVNGLNGYPPGLTIIAHAQTKKDMEEAFQKDDALKPLLAYLPTRTFADGFDLKGLAREIRLIHFGPAHTSGDMVVYFPVQKTAFVGDLAFVGRDPLVHKQKGGSFAGLVKTLKGLEELDAETFVAGHNDPLTKADIATLRKGLEEKEAKVREMIAAGKSLDDIQAAFGIAAPAAGAQPARRWPNIVEIIYQELTEKK